MELKSSHEDKSNLDKIFLETSIICSSSSKRRIKKEYELLCETYPNIHFSSNIIFIFFF